MARDAEEGPQEPSPYHRDDENAPLIDAAAAPPAGGGSSGVAALPAWRRPLAALWNNGVACVLVSAFAFSVASACVKLVQGRIPVFEMVLSRAVFSTTITAATARLRGVSVFGRTAPLPLKLARGLIGASAMVCAYESITRLPLADSTIIFYLSPVFTALLGLPLLGESFGWRTLLGCCASLAGVALVAQPGSAAVGWGRQRLWGMAFGFGGAVLAAGAYICIRLIGKREHPLTIAMYFHTFSLLLSVVPLALGYPAPAVLPSPVEAVLLLMLASCSFVANLLVSRALQIEMAAKATAINFTQVIFAWIIGSVFFGDPITPIGVAGTLLIAAGVIAVNLEKMVRQPGSGAAAAMAGSAGDKAGGEPGLPVVAAPDRVQPGAGPWLRGGQGLEGWPLNGTAGLDWQGRLKAKSSFRVELPSAAGRGGDAAEGGSGGVTHS